MPLKQIVGGLLSWIPGLEGIGTRDPGGALSARYCYSVWLRHLIMADRAGLPTAPLDVAELGPGNSIGVGLIALLCGAEYYHALDVVPAADLKRNLEVFDELVELLTERVDLPDDKEFPRMKPYLDAYGFPGHILTGDRLAVSLDEARVSKIRWSIENADHPDSMIRYTVPWLDPGVQKRESVDMILSQAVLEHVEDLEHAYRTMHAWLKPSGFLSHQIDFKCHGTTREWNGHWACSDFHWKLLKGRRLFLINRQPISAHTRLLDAAGFRIVNRKDVTTESKVTRNQLAPRFDSLTDEDLRTSGVFIQAVKKWTPGTRATTKMGGIRSVEK